MKSQDLILFSQPLKAFLLKLKRRKQAEISPKIYFCCTIIRLLATRNSNDPSLPLSKQITIFVVEHNSIILAIVESRRHSDVINQCMRTFPCQFFIKHRNIPSFASENFQFSLFYFLLLILDYIIYIFFALGRSTILFQVCKKLASWEPFFICQIMVHAGKNLFCPQIIYFDLKVFCINAFLGEDKKSINM